MIGQSRVNSSNLKKIFFKCTADAIEIVPSWYGRGHSMAQVQGFELPIGLAMKILQAQLWANFRLKRQTQSPICYITEPCMQNLHLVEFWPSGSKCFWAIFYLTKNLLKVTKNPGQVENRLQNVDEQYNEIFLEYFFNLFLK